MKEIEILREELKRKDELIARLKQENSIILRTALKQSRKNIELSQQLERLRKKF